MIPLQKPRADLNENELPLSYSQFLYYVQQTNHKSIWKSTYKKYSSKDLLNQNEVNSSSGIKSGSESVTSNLLPYELVLREVIIRMYGCPIVHFKLDRLGADPSFDEPAVPHQFDVDSLQVNHYPFIAVIETNAHFYLLYHPVIENNLMDCVTYSPAILEKSHNKPLFIVYQLLNLMKSIHDAGLIMGTETTLSDFYLTENLLIRCIPRIDQNLLHYEETQENNNLGDVARPSPILDLQYSLKDYCQMWCTGNLSNFDYLTILNNFAGRRIDSAGYHQIMPWVIDFTSKSGNWRDLTKTKYRLTKGDAQLDITFQHIKNNAECNAIPHHVSDVLSEITYFVYMARKTPKSVLCKHVRPKFVAAEYPATIKRLQEWSPDECIPEFFTDPSIFKSIHEDLPNLEIPAWSSCPEDFVVKHRQALESEYVSENLHHWIDLTFGYKLNGKAAVKAKNVVLSNVDEHKNLCQRGVVQLFTSHHPPRQTKNPWFQKLPPRINNLEIKRRLTRSSEDLSMDNFYSMESSSASTSRLSGSPRSSSRLPHQSESIERSPSYNVGVLRSSQNTISLPPNYNPLAQLKAVETMGNFIAKTFYQDPSPKNISTLKPTNECTDYPLTTSFENYLAHTYEKDPENAFTNKMFLETYEASLKDSKMYQNLKQRKKQLQNSKKNFKLLLHENRTKDLKLLGCLIMELFLSKKLRPWSKKDQLFEERFEACLLLLKHEEQLLPPCVVYAVKLLFGISVDEVQITDMGLPAPNAQQLLQPILYNVLIPFPKEYYQVYSAIKALSSFHSAAKMLDYYAFYECDRNCEKYEAQDKIRIGLHRKIAECKVKAFTVLIDGLLEPRTFEQFDVVELLLPHIIDLIQNEETGILSAWYLFDPVATSLGLQKTKTFLLNPILSLYDVQHEAKSNLMNSSYESSEHYRRSSFRSKKAAKLYHHSFLLKLILRFGLKCFLDNFISVLIEAAGGCKDTEMDFAFHLHDSEQQISVKDTVSQSVTEMDSPTLISSGSNEDDDKTISTRKDLDEMFAFDNDEASHCEAENLIAKLMDPFDLKSETGSIDMQMNLSEAEENCEHETVDGGFILGDDKIKINKETEEQMDPKSPTTIPIPTFRRGIVASIVCGIGSKLSNDSFDLLSKTPLERDESICRDESTRSTDDLSKSKLKPIKSTRISEMSSESLIWLSHRLGPCLTARYITRNLLKMLTLCYVSQENLLPSSTESPPNNISQFSVADGRVVGDDNSQRVLDCLMSIAALFGEPFIFHQYFPHVTELIVLCKKKVTMTLEGGLVSCLQLIKYLVPCLSDAMIMDQLQETILKNIIKPIIRLLNSTHMIMPSGFLARGVLARKLIDLLYVLTVRIGTETARQHLCVPHLQRFFLIFNKAYGNEDSDDSLTPEQREKGLEELREVFTPSLAHSAYLPFVKQLGETIMRQTVANLEIIVNLCHEYDMPNSYHSESIQIQDSSTFMAVDHVDSPHSFGTNVSIVGNRLDFQSNDAASTEQNDLIDLVAYKLKDLSSNRQLKGNWLAYWTHEIGRSDKEQGFNLKQIKLQTFAGHANSIRAILCLDNENSFMTASKDRTVKLWSLRSEGDGTKISPCQFTYTGHKRSVHSLAFLESLRCTVSCDSGVHLWDPFVGDGVSQLDSPRYAPVSIVRTYPGPSSLVLAGTADSTIKLIDARTAEYIMEWKLTSTPSGSVRCLTVAPSGKWIAVGLSAGQIVMLDGRSGTILASWKASESELLQMQAPSDHELVTSSLDHSISLWNAQTGSLKFHLKYVI